MSAATLSPALTGTAERTTAARGAPQPQTCAVRLIDRRTGQTHRVNGSPLLIFTKSPGEAAEDLLAGRDRALWEARIEPIGGAS
ncbi:hypothetical protein C0V75_11305 [Tabrizicola sp. TH137]|uniref:hypothetical protein n=1 Tax=Tabrizicola sp. TH137 TaxID=2067452 RepID=UPI000C79AAD2|nr:hypothetical protein [Tabrizicola sp. TH137]PLL12525.1 hypothetical protein C0V75_11305 [Tabrizicola sp. TH137]